MRHSFQERQLVNIPTKMTFNTVISLVLTVVLLGCSVRGQKERCEKQCLTHYEKRVAENQFDNLDRINMYYSCTPNCALPKAQCDSVCLQQFNKRNIENTLSTFQRNILFNECRTECNQLTNRDQCETECLDQYNYKMKTGQQTQQLNHVTYNSCKVKCSGLPAAPSTNTNNNNNNYNNNNNNHNNFNERNDNNKEEDKKEKVMTEAEKADKMKCDDMCLTRYNQRRDQGFFTQEQRIQMYDECKVECSSNPVNVIDRQTIENIKTAADAKATCIKNCGIQAARQTGSEIDRVLVLNACTKTCDSLDGGSGNNPNPDTGDNTQGGTGGNSGNPGTGSNEPKVSQEKCNWRCENQYTNLKAKGTFGEDFLKTVRTKCKTKCLSVDADTNGMIADKCTEWANGLREKYMTEENKEFLDKLYSRALQTCTP